MDEVTAIETRRAEFIQRPLRIAVVSTPRSGNTWFRGLLASTYGLQDWAVHNPADLDWAGLPSGYIIQIHWHRVESFTSLLDEHRFRVVVLSRHPLDVLISILHFAPHESATARWLEGEGGNEVPIYDVLPCSQAFLDYATGPRAAALLGVSDEWRQVTGCHCLRYEDLVRDPAGELRRLGEAFGHLATPEAIAGAIAANSLENLRPTTHNQHFWKGQPGLWKALLPAEEARRIARAHRMILQGGGYVCDPDESLDRGRADANWLLLANETFQRSLSETRAKLEVLQRSLSVTRAELAASQRDVGEIQMQLAATVSRLGSFEDLGPTAIRLARRLKRLSRRFPRLASSVRRLMTHRQHDTPHHPHLTGSRSVRSELTPTGDS